jgi:hypothetical protein
MARLADQFTAIDADDLLRPIGNPSEIAVKWEDGTKSTYRIPVTFTETAFHGRRVGSCARVVNDAVVSSM